MIIMTIKLPACNALGYGLLAMDNVYVGANSTIIIHIEVALIFKLLVSFRGFFEDYIFCMVKYLSFQKILLLPYHTF